jgi:hypothetical protein
MGEYCDLCDENVKLLKTKLRWMTASWEVARCHIEVLNLAWWLIDCRLTSSGEYVSRMHVQKKLIYTTINLLLKQGTMRWSYVDVLNYDCYGKRGHSGWVRKKMPYNELPITTSNSLLLIRNCWKFSFPCTEWTVFREWHALCTSPLNEQ